MFRLIRCNKRTDRLRILYIEGQRIRLLIDTDAANEIDDLYND